MKIPLLLAQAFACVLFGSAQQSRTFTIEKLETKDGILPTITYQDALRKIILLENSNGEGLESNPNFPYNIVAKDKVNDSLIYYGNHPFFDGLWEAYAQHHPFTLSPDMIWLLISQGFAHHVTNNAEQLRSMFVNFEGKKKLEVNNNAIVLDDPNSPWEDVFPEFTKKIGENTGQDLINTLTPNFTTTTPIDKIAAQITIMDALKDYFEYYVIAMVCGIPKITLEGTPADWQKIIDKANALRKYKLGWWVDEIVPPLKKIVLAAKGQVDTAFWLNIFKYHKPTGPYGPSTINGWIVKFFPYDKDGHRESLTKLNNANNLPNEMVTVDVTHILDNGARQDTTPLELWAGFVGVKENNQSLGLKPVTGWMVRKKNNSSIVLKNTLRDFKEEEGSTIDIKVKTVPPEILALKSIDELTIHFFRDIIIPDELANCKINNLRLYGHITQAEQTKIFKLFPNTHITINAGY